MLLLLLLLGGGGIGLDEDGFAWFLVGEHLEPFVVSLAVAAAHQVGVERLY